MGGGPLTRGLRALSFDLTRSQERCVCVFYSKGICWGPMMTEFLGVGVFVRSWAYFGSGIKVRGAELKTALCGEDGR